jgi:DNA replication protein DnaC
VRAHFETYARRAEGEALSYEGYLHELVREELATRRAHKIERLLRESKLPLEKSLETFDMARLPTKAARQVKTLVEGAFLDHYENVLVFGRPGSGKTHLLCGLAQSLVRQGRRVLFSTASLLVQQLLAAKRELDLGRCLKRMGTYDALLIDDIGYVKHDRDEMEVLFTLLADRYERGTVMMTSNLPFSRWEEIFKDPMTTAAAIDRLVHHSVIIDLNVRSYREEKALQRQRGESDDGRATSDAGAPNSPTGP